MARPYGSRNAQERDYVTPMVHSDRKGMVRLTGMVPADLHAMAYRNAKAAGITMGLYLKRLVEQDQLNEDGVPLWRIAELDSESAADEQEGEQLRLTG
ncbi:hypothetical protein ABZ027_31755 [Streptomyces sp. NPDC006332]|uniref:hypothetical protein n=1 Tax=Streptomyces sp. NPDC006332 TaxID=3155456 RepID=UPI0033BBD1D8